MGNVILYLSASIIFKDKSDFNARVFPQPGQRSPVIL